MSAIDVLSIFKKFGNDIALDNISFQVKKNEIFGFLGPNGAGKSTTIMILTTLLKPTSGKAYVNNFDILSQSKLVRQSIGYVQQDIVIDEYLTGRENLLLQARLNHLPKKIIDSRIDDILHLIELYGRQNDLVINYSGGMRKRLDIACGLIHFPSVLFLDEPTLGLDIQTRHKIWDHIKKIRNEFDVTIFITTHYMEEADILCDRIGIIDRGKIKVIDSPQKLKDELGNEIIILCVDKNKQNILISEIKKIDFVKNIKSTQDGKIFVFTSNGSKVIPMIFKTTVILKIKINSIIMSQPKLDDVFIKYTGKEIRNDNDGFNRKKEHKKMTSIRK